VKIGKNPKRKKLTSLPLTIISQGRLLFIFGEGKHPKSCEYLVLKFLKMLLPLILLVRRLEGQGMGSQQSSPNVCDGKIPPQLRFQSNKKNPLTFKPKRANLWGQTCVKCFFWEKSIICTTNHFLVQKSTFLILSLNLKRISSSQKVYGNLFIWFFILGHLGTIPSPRAFVGPPLAGTCLPTGVESPAMLGY